MKVSETVSNYPSERRMYANYVVKNVKNLCKNTGSRPAGSEKEYEAQNFMAEDLKHSCDTVDVESFDVHPKAYLGWIKFDAVCGAIAAVLLFLTRFAFIPQFLVLPFAAAGIVLSVLCLFFAVTESLFRGKTFDAFSSKATSHNVIGVRKSAGETKRRIILSGHCDSSPEWRFVYWGGQKLVTLSTVLCLLGYAVVIVSDIMVLLAALNGTKPADSSLVGILSIVCVCFAPVFLFMLLFSDAKHPVEGANDDLTGTFCAMSAVRYLQDHDIRFENTEVVCLCTGSEEAGLRGAKAFCKAHAKEYLAQKDVETVCVDFDALRDFDCLAVSEKDMTGLVKNDSQVAGLIKAGAALADYDLPGKTVSPGATGAAALSKAGLKCAGLTAKNTASARFYRTRLDARDNLDLKTIEAGVDICLNTVFLFDEKGLDI